MGVGLLSPEYMLVCVLEIVVDWLIGFAALCIGLTGRSDKFFWISVFRSSSLSY